MMTRLLVLLIAGSFLAACGDSGNKNQSQDTKPPQWMEQERIKMKQRSGSSSSKIPSLLDDDELTPDKQDHK